jgi:hypothetical protein
MSVDCRSATVTPESIVTRFCVYEKHDMICRGRCRIICGLLDFPN